MDSLREAELAILNAPFAERGWERAVAAVAAATRSHAAQLLGIGGPLTIPLNVFVGPPAEYRHYIESAELHGPCNWRVGSTTVPMAIQYEADYAAYRAFHHTEHYDDVASEMDIPFGCQSALLMDSRSLIGIAILRGRRDGPCGAETIARFTALRSQLARAVKMQIALDGEAAELMVGEMGSLVGATILLDRHGGIAALTPAAQGLLDGEGPLRLCGVSVELPDPAENARFGQMMARLLKAGNADVAEMRVGRAPDRPRGAWRLFVTRLPHRPDHGLGFDPHLALTLKPVG